MSSPTETTLNAPTPADEKLLRRTFEIARASRDKGNHPFGALLADESGTVVLEAENTVLTSGDRTRHAELNLLAKASQGFDRAFLQGSSLYSSTEPCSMCATAVRWVGVGRIVFGLSQLELQHLANPGPRQPLRGFTSRDVLALSGRRFTIIGPLLEDEAREPHSGFWGNR